MNKFAYCALIGAASATGAQSFFDDLMAADVYLTQSQILSLSTSTQLSQANQAA